MKVPFLSENSPRAFTRTPFLSDQVVDSHTAGEPTRGVVAEGPVRTRCSDGPPLRVFGKYALNLPLQHRDCVKFTQSRCTWKAACLNGSGYFNNFIQNLQTAVVAAAEAIDLY